MDDPPRSQRASKTRLRAAQCALNALNDAGLLQFLQQNSQLIRRHIPQLLLAAEPDAAGGGGVWASSLSPEDVESYLPTTQLDQHLLELLQRLTPLIGSSDAREAGDAILSIEGRAQAAEWLLRTCFRYAPRDIESQSQSQSDSESDSDAGDAVSSMRARRCRLAVRALLAIAHADYRELAPQDYSFYDEREKCDPSNSSQSTQDMAASLGEDVGDISQHWDTHQFKRLRAVLSDMMLLEEGRCNELIGRMIVDVVKGSEQYTDMVVEWWWSENEPLKETLVVVSKLLKLSKRDYKQIALKHFKAMLERLLPNLDTANSSQFAVHEERKEIIDELLGPLRDILELHHSSLSVDSTVQYRGGANGDAASASASSSPTTASAATQTARIVAAKRKPGLHGEWEYTIELTGASVAGGAAPQQISGVSRDELRSKERPKLGTSVHLTEDGMKRLLQRWVELRPYLFDTLEDDEVLELWWCVLRDSTQIFRGKSGNRKAALTALRMMGDLLGRSAVFGIFPLSLNDGEDTYEWVKEHEQGMFDMMQRLMQAGFDVQIESETELVTRRVKGALSCQSLDMKALVESNGGLGYECDQFMPFTSIGKKVMRFFSREDCHLHFISPICVSKTERDLLATPGVDAAAEKLKKTKRTAIGIKKGVNCCAPMIPFSRDTHGNLHSLSNSVRCAAKAAVFPLLARMGAFVEWESGHILDCLGRRLYIEMADGTTGDLKMMVGNLLRLLLDDHLYGIHGTGKCGNATPCSFDVSGLRQQIDLSFVHDYTAIFQLLNVAYETRDVTFFKDEVAPKFQVIVDALVSLVANDNSELSLTPSLLWMSAHATAVIDFLVESKFVFNDMDEGPSELAHKKTKQDIGDGTGGNFGAYIGMPLRDRGDAGLGVGNTLRLAFEARLFAAAVAPEIGGGDLRKQRQRAMRRSEAAQVKLARRWRDALAFLRHRSKTMHSAAWSIADRSQTEWEVTSTVTPEFIPCSSEGVLLLAWSGDETAAIQVGGLGQKLVRINQTEVGSLSLEKITTLLARMKGKAGKGARGLASGSGSSGSASGDLSFVFQAPEADTGQTVTSDELPHLTADGWLAASMICNSTESSPQSRALFGERGVGASTSSSGDDSSSSDEEQEEEDGARDDAQRTRASETLAKRLQAQFADGDTGGKTKTKTKPREELQNIRIGFRHDVFVAKKSRTMMLRVSSHSGHKCIYITVDDTSKDECFHVKVKALNVRGYYRNKETLQLWLYTPALIAIGSSYKGCSASNPAPAASANAQKHVVVTLKFRKFGQGKKALNSARASIDRLLAGMAQWDSIAHWETYKLARGVTHDAKDEAGKKEVASQHRARVLRSQSECMRGHCIVLFRAVGVLFHMKKLIRTCPMCAAHVYKTVDAPEEEAVWTSGFRSVETDAPHTHCVSCTFDKSRFKQFEAATSSAGDGDDTSARR